MTNETLIEDLTLVHVPEWWESPWVWLAGLLVLSAVAYALARWYRSRPRPTPVPTPAPPSPPPHFEALRRLALLRARHPTLSAYALAIECSEILRDYLAQRLSLPARFQTSREFLALARSHPALDAPTCAALTELLALFDGLKFARASVDPAGTLNAIDSAEAIVRATTPAAAPPEPRP